MTKYLKESFLNIQLIDAKESSLEEISTHGSFSTVESLFRISGKKKVSEAEIDLFFKTVIQEKHHQCVLDYMNKLVRYALYVMPTDKADFQARFNQMLPKLEDKMNTIAEQLIEEGIEKGIQSIIKNMLENNLKLNEIAKMIGLDLKEVKQIAETL